LTPHASLLLLPHGNEHRLTEKATRSYSVG
jgi:hypothetical protein